MDAKELQDNLDRELKKQKDTHLLRELEFKAMCELSNNIIFFSKYAVIKMRLNLEDISLN